MAILFFSEVSEAGDGRSHKKRTPQDPCLVFKSDPRRVSRNMWRPRYTESTQSVEQGRMTGQLRLQKTR